MNPKFALEFVKRTLENVASASVKTLMRHTFKVDIGEKSFRVSNFPAFPKLFNVTLTNEQQLEKDIKRLILAVQETKASIESQKPIESLRVTNIADAPKAPESVTVKNPVNSVRINNFDELGAFLEEIIEHLEQLPKEYPQVKIPEYPKFPEFPRITIPEYPKSIDVNNLKEIVELLRSNKPEDYIPVRLSNGEEFYEALDRIVTTTSAAGYAYRKEGTNQKVLGMVDEEGKVVATVRETPNPLEKYKLSDKDNTTDPRYYGFLSADGSWYIMQEDKVAGTYRYFTGESNYIAGWANREDHTYLYLDEAF